MKKQMKKIMAILCAAIAVFIISVPVIAVSETADSEIVASDETNETDSEGSGSNEAKAWPAAFAVGFAAAAGAIAMGIAIGKASDGISRQPEATGNIRTNLMLGLVFIETLIIYALIVAILIIFVL